MSWIQKTLGIMVGVALILGSYYGKSQAIWDDFLGDSVIYVAGGGARKPNILFIIDRSMATLNNAAGIEYDPNQTYSGTRRPWDIYESDNKGIFATIAVNNPIEGESGYDSTSKLKNLSCDGYPVVKDSLLKFGTYSGSGTSAAPIIKANRDRCETASNGATYALGNFLNYLDQPPPNPVVVGADGKDYYLVASHNSAVVPKPASLPASLSNWDDYWALAGTVGQGSTWLSNYDYLVPSVRTQKEVMYRALTAAIASKFASANFGFATYGESNKGAIIFQPLKSLTLADVAIDSDNTSPIVPDFFKKIPGSGDSLALATYSAGPQRSQGEALYDAGYYLAGGAAGTPYSPISTTSKIDSAIRNPCGDTHIIFITNGLSNGDSDPKLTGITLNADGSKDYSADPNIDLRPLGADVANEGSYGLGTHHLDDVAWYLNHNHQITTHVILAFQQWDRLSNRAAVNGGGSFFNVFSQEDLRRAIEQIIIPIIEETNSSFVAPVVPANPENRTFSGSRIYLGFFLPQNGQPWYGNLKKFGIDSEGQVVDKNGVRATCPDYDAGGNLLPICSSTSNGGFKSTSISYWSSCTHGETCGDGSKVDEGGVGEVLYNSSLADRQIYTFLGDFSTEKNLTLAVNRFDKRDTVRNALGMAGTTAEKDAIIDFVYGYDVWDYDNNGISTEKRNWILGDILHSKPLVLGYNSFEYEQEGICPSSSEDWANTLTGINKSVIFVGANDGMLHAFRDCDGKEMWAFLPPDLLPKLPYLDTETNPGHQYYVDGTPTAYVLDKNKDKAIRASDGDMVILMFGLRRGGGKETLLENIADDPSTSRGAIYGLNVTNPAEPLFLGKFDNTTALSGTLLAGEMGETWSQPTLAMMNINSVKILVAIVGAGYDNNEDLRFGNTQTFPVGIVPSPDPDPMDTSFPTDTTSPTDDAYTDGSGNPKTSSGDGTRANPKGRGIYFFEVGRYEVNTFTQQSSWNFSYAGSLIKEMTHSSYSIPSDLTVLDTDYNGYVDRIYVGDTGGQIWRYDVGATDTAAWTSRIIFKANLSPTDSGYSTAEKGRKIFYRPSVVVKSGYVALVFGTGDRVHPLNLAVVDRLYMVKDKGQTTAKAESDLINVTSYPQGLTSAQLTALENGYGWYIKLPAGEKVLAPALVFSGIAYFTTYTPSSETTVINSCSEGNLGTSRLWAVNFRDGSAAFNFDTSNDPETGEPVNERFDVLGDGIPSGLVPVINEDGTSGGFIGCGEGLCKPPDSNNKLVYPLYWKQW